MTIAKLCRTFFVVALAILGLSSAVATYAQSGQADVQGVVTDATGSVIVGAQVTLTNTDSGDKRFVKTASDGRYTFPTVAPGKYSITVSASSFSPETITGLELQLDNHFNQNVTLKAGSEAQTVTVSGTVPAVDTTSYDVGGVIQQEQIEDLPIQNRAYLNLALLVPGTSQDTSRNFYNNVQAGAGTGFYQNGFYLDGVTNQQTEEGDPRQNIPEGAVSEFKTYTSSYSADHGWAMGGFTTVVTKSGGNKIHGDAFEYLRTTGMTVPSTFTIATDTLEGTGNPQYTRNQFGGSIGGPIKKDKIHYFAAYDQFQLQQSYTLYVAPALQSDYSSLLGVFPQPIHDDNLLGRVDIDLTPKQQLFARYAQEWNLESDQGCGGSSTVGCYTGQLPRWAIVVGHTWEPTSRIVNESRFQYAFISYELGPYGTTPPKKPQDFLNPNYINNNITTSYSFPSFSWGHTYTADGVETRWELNDSVTIQKGRHTFKFGGDDSYVPYTDATGGNLGSWSFTTDQPFNPSSATSLAGLVNARTYSQTLKSSLFFLPSTQQSYYFMDTFKAKPNLTITAGIRYDVETGSPFLNTYTPNPTAYPTSVPIPFEGDPHQRGDKNNWGPRLGFSWDPRNKDKDVIRGGYGIYYNFIETELQEGEKLNFYQCSISLQTGSPAGYTLTYPNPFGTGTAASYCSTAPPSVTIIAPNFHNAYNNQFSLGYSRQLSRNYSVSVDGLYARSLGQEKTFDRNYPINPPLLTIRPDTALKTISQRTSTGAAEYKGVYFKVEKRMANRYMFTASYSLTSQHDNLAGPTLYSAAAPSQYLGLDWGPSSVDQRHAVILSGSVLLPWKIQLGAINTFRSAEPFSETTTTLTSYAYTDPTTGLPTNDGFGVFATNPSPDGTAQYVPGTTRGSGNRKEFNFAALNTYREQLNDHAPPTIPGLTKAIAPSSYYSSCHPTTSATPVCLATNLNQSMMHSPRVNNFDIHISRQFHIHESMNVTIIGQAFDLFGVQPEGGATSATSYTWGIPASSGNTRQIGELAAKFTF